MPIAAGISTSDAVDNLKLQRFLAAFMAKASFPHEAIIYIENYYTRSEKVQTAIFIQFLARLRT